MYFSIATVYAFQALAAMPDNGKFYVAKELATGLDLPCAYLSKILTALAAKGLLDSVRGPGGGYRLGSPAHLITLGDVVSALDGPDLTPACLIGTSACDSKDTPCPMQATCTRLVDQVETTLTQVTIQQLQISHRNQVRTAVAKPLRQRWVG